MSSRSNKDYFNSDDLSNNLSMYDTQMENLMKQANQKLESQHQRCKSIASSNIVQYVECFNQNQSRNRINQFVNQTFPLALSFAQTKMIKCIESKGEEQCLGDNRKQFNEAIDFLKKELRYL